jgi:hypothetical protein
MYLDSFTLVYSDMTSFVLFINLLHHRMTNCTFLILFLGLDFHFVVDIDMQPILTTSELISLTVAPKDMGKKMSC